MAQGGHDAAAGGGCAAAGVDADRVRPELVRGAAHGVGAGVRGGGQAERHLHRVEER